MAEVGIEKVTWMKLKTAPLNVEKNFTKVKKALCSIAQIRDQKFDEENNTVTIKVVCCSPEKVMNKLCSKGKGAIKLIETIDPPKPQAPKPNEAGKSKEPEKTKPAAGQASTSGSAPAPAQARGPGPAQPGPSSQPATMIQGYNPASMMSQPAPWSNQVNYGWSQPNGYEQRPVYDSYGGMPPPPPQYGGRPHYETEEEQQPCSIM